ncbi:restriction endonuclease [Clostridium hydrogeniformans]|uniref:restriction endonuclease n=1 Tax=Clostridium hydrogeniformans TaxID=349933 RepID=UPI00055112A4|nr:restriction endonuclease [Clostridium hydrogeniformans]
MEGKCELCCRKGVELTEHHLVPKEYGGNDFDRAMLCIPCHKQIHALYGNRELAVRLYNIEKLKNDYRVKKFLRWIKKQPIANIVNVKKSKHKRRTKN